MNKILLIDGHSILNRAFYGLPDLTNFEGLHTNAVLGFLNIIFQMAECRFMHIKCYAHMIRLFFVHDLKYNVKETKNCICMQSFIVCKIRNNDRKLLCKGCC